MKIHHLIPTLLFCLLVSCSKVQGGWFDKGNDEQKQKLIQLESELQGQHKKIDQWELIAGTLGVACILLFVMGTAIGTRTRHAASPA